MDSAFQHNRYNWLTEDQARAKRVCHIGRFPANYRHGQMYCCEQLESLDHSLCFVLQTNVIDFEVMGLGSFAGALTVVARFDVKSEKRVSISLVNAELVRHRCNKQQSDSFLS